MAAELPVLHIADELNKGQVVNGVNGYIFHNAMEMHQLLLKYRDMPTEERQALKHAARESVAKSGAETLAKNLLEVYRIALETKKLEDAQKVQ